ncbi:MAG: hypothetical protein ACK5FX_09985, partial [Flavobacteriia bacterium]
MRLLLLFIVLTLTGQLFSQRKMEWGIEYRQKIGFLAAHRGVMGHLPRNQALAGELTWFVNTKGRKQWHAPSSYPTYGVTGFFGSVGNNEILGRFGGAYGFIEFPFIDSKHYQFSGK